MPNVDYTIATRPCTGETVCGDLGWVKRFDDKIFLALLDVAGHGPEAEALARKCPDFFEAHYEELSLPGIIQSLHEFVKASKGLVVGLCVLDIPTGVLHYSGMGNIEVKIFGKQSYTFVARNGVVGYQITRPIWEAFLLNIGDVLLMHTDGISSYFNKKDYPGIANDDVDTIAKTMIDRFGKAHDDVGCIVMKYLA